MNARVIEHILSTNPYTYHAFQGFNTFDIPLPRITHPAIIILNTDCAEGPGEHWCVANFVDNNICEFFDPYGFSPCFYDFDKIIYKKAKRILYNPDRLQGDLPTCGHHCLFYVLKRYYGNTPDCILNHLYKKDDRSYNDAMVYDFIKNEFGYNYAKFLPDFNRLF